MIRNSFTKAALIGTVVASAFAGASFAQGAVGGAWKIDSARFNDGWASISIERESAAASQSKGQFIVIDGGNVYLATGMDAHAVTTTGGKIANAGGKLVLIGTHARRGDFCSFKCQYGLPEQSLTLRFLSLEGAEQLMGEMVAYNKR